MSVLDTLITDRTEEQVNRLRQLLAKGWQAMTDDEKYEYLNGSPSQLYDSQNQRLNDRNGAAVLGFDGIIRGAYNYTDLNRVETVVAYVADELAGALDILQDYATEMGVSWDDYYGVPYDPDDYESLTVKTDWDETDIPSATQMARYIGNIKLIRDAIPDSSNAWIPDTMDGLTYETANNIEQLLIDVDVAVAALIALKKGYIRSTLAVYYSGEIYSGEGDYS